MDIYISPWKELIKDMVIFISDSIAVVINMFKYVSAVVLLPLPLGGR